MRIIKGIKRGLLFKKPGIVAIGYFDGIHLGHRAIINELLRISKEKKLSPFILTFDQLPQKEANGKRISTLKDKLAIFKEMGIKNIILCKFTNDFLNLSPKLFLEILKRKFKIEEYVSSSDFCFGYQKSGNSITIKENGFISNIVQPVIDGGVKISSSIIKDLILSGQVDKVQNYLGRSFFVSGIVKKGKQLGRVLGFPTCNINNYDLVQPKDGVYITQTEINNKQYYSMTYIRETLIESNLIGFNKFVYGMQIKVAFLKKIRDNIKFENRLLLIDQLKTDLQTTKNYVAELQK